MCGACHLWSMASPVVHHHHLPPAAPTSHLRDTMGARHARIGLPSHSYGFHVITFVPSRSNPMGTCMCTGAALDGPGTSGTSGTSGLEALEALEAICLSETVDGSGGEVSQEMHLVLLPSLQDSISNIVHLVCQDDLGLSPSPPPRVSVCVVCVCVRVRGGEGHVRVRVGVGLRGKARCARLSLKARARVCA